MKILRNILFSLLGFIFILIILINLPSVQNYLAQKTASYLAQKLHTVVSVKNVRFHLLNAAAIEGLYIEDQQKDTLLYAGTATINITDWFIFKRKPTIRFIGLKDAYIYLNRSKNSSRWNDQFLLDAFSSKKETGKKGSGSINLNLKKVKLENVHFYAKDAWVGTDMGGSVGNMVLNARDLNFKNKTIALKNIKGDKVTFGIVEYTGGRPPRPKSNVPPEIDTTPFNPGKWTVNLGKLDLSNSHFYLEYPEEKVPQGIFDEDHLNITGINILAADLNIRGDTIKADLKHLSAKERCGLEIKEMHARITVSPNIASCEQLYLQTGNSIITDYYAMRYERFPDFIDYIQKVKMEAHLKDAEIGIQDIAYFAPGLAPYKNLSVQFNGKGIGTVDRLMGKDLVIKDGLSTLTGNISINGLPNLDHTFIDFREGELKTSGMAALFYAPALKDQKIADIEALKQVDFKGNFTGFFSDFVAYGTFYTNLGTAKADINMKLPKHALPVYSGSLATHDFDIGRLFFQDYAGKTTFSATLKGKGFKQKNVVLDVDGNISHLYIYNYDYHNIAIKGELRPRHFEGLLNVNDPNVDLDFSGKIDFGRETPLYDFYAKANYFNTQALHITDDPISGNAEMKLNLEGNNFDDFIGTAYVYNINLKRDSTKLKIDSVQLVSRLNDQKQRQLILTTNDLFAKIYGQYSLKQLPRSFQLFLSYYLPQYIKSPGSFQTDQNFQFEIKAGEPNDLLSLVDQSLQIGDHAQLNGSLNMSEQKLQLQGEVPFLAYRKLLFKDVKLNSEGNYSGLKVNILANNIKMAGADIISTLDFKTNIFRDTASFQLLTTSPTSIGEAKLNGTAIANNDSFYLRITPSEFYLNKKKWKIPANNLFVFAPGYFSASDFRIENESQQVLINPPDHTLAPNNALVVFKNIDLSVFNSITGFETMNFKGLMNGTVTAKSIVTDPGFDFYLTGDEVTIGEDTIGKIVLAGAYDINKGLLQLEKETGISYQDAYANISGNFNLTGNTKEQVDAVINLKNAKTVWLAPFLTGYVSQLSGTLDGNIDINGDLDRFTASGHINLNNAGFTPDLIGVHYHIRNGIINIDGNTIDLDNLKVYDDHENEGILSGIIEHNGLKDFYLRLRLNSNNIQVVNLTSTEGDRFYGKVFADVQARLNGPWDDLKMNVFAKAQKNSHLFIPIGYGSDLGAYNYIHFKSYDTASGKIKPANQNKISFHLDAIVTPDMETSIILDPSTGDRIWVKGNGNIILDIPSDGELKMNGNYVIDEGTYDFSFKQLQILNYKKQFTINPNSTIKWNGDITDANLDVSAYATIKARLYDLIQGEVDRLNLSNEEIRDAQIAQDVNVLMSMKGSLSEPDMKFKIQLVEARSVGTYAYQKLERINGNEKQLLNQVASLLLLGQFVPPEGINNYAISSGTINNMSELFASAASSQITNFANKILGMEDLYIGVRYKNYSLSQSDLNAINYFNRNEAGLNLRKNFFNDRLVVEVGGVYDWGQTVSQNNFTAKLAGDFRIQYLLTEDGRIRSYIFRNSNYDALSLQNISRQGLGLSYRKSFNGLSDLFQSQKSSWQKQKLKTPPAPKEIKEVDSLQSKQQSVGINR